MELVAWMAVLAAMVFFSIEIYRVPEFLPQLKEAPEPHQCSKGGVWMPQMRTRTMRVGTRGSIEMALVRSGGEVSYVQKDIEVVAVICEGVFCSACEQKLVCGSCGNTPVSETVLDSQLDHLKILQCCDNPVFVDWKKE